MSTALFLDALAVTDVDAAVDRARLRVRAAKRWTTKAESKGGQAAHKALHEAETALDSALRVLRGGANG